MTTKQKSFTVTPETYANISLLAKMAVRQKRLGSTLQGYRMRDELRCKHLINRDGSPSKLISLKCAQCRTEHPKSPAALAWWKLAKDKNQLSCPTCRGKNFFHSRRQTPQGELMAEAIHKHTRQTKKYIDNEVSTI